MRNYFKNPSLESEDDQEILEDDDLLADATPDEEAVIAQEAMDDAAGAESDLSDAERIIEVSDALEDLAVIADGIEEATPTEIALIENTGNMAVAGSDVDPEEVVPAMESFQGGRIATEGIRETARTIWESILRFLKSIWEKIEGFFYKVLGSIPMLRRKLEALKKRIFEAKDKTLRKGKDGGQGSVGLILATHTLSINYVAVKNAGDIRKGLSGLSTAISYVFKDYMASVSTRGHAIANAIGDFNPNKPEEALLQLRSELKKVKSPTLPGGTASTRFPEFETTIGTPMLGNVSLANKLFKDPKEAASHLGALDRYRRAGLELVPTSDKSKESKASVSIPPMTTNDMELLVDEMLDILVILENYKRGATAKNITSTKNAIESASAKASKAMAEVKSSTGASGESKESKSAREKADLAGHTAALPFYRSLLNFNTSYARWAKDPAIPLLGHSMTVMRAVAALVDRSCSAYGTEKEDTKFGSPAKQAGKTASNALGYSKAAGTSLVA